jgi:uncharacterized protein DUF4085
MRYYTRKRYLQIQDDAGCPESDLERDRRQAIAKGEWEIANNEYNDYVSRTRILLPPTLQYVLDISLHDADIASVQQLDTDAEVSFSFGEASWFPENVSRLVLRFHGVIYERGLANAVGQSLLYREIFVFPGYYEFSALLVKTELVIQFRDVEIETDPRNRARRAPLRIE